MDPPSHEEASFPARPGVSRGPTRRPGRNAFPGAMVVVDGAQSHFRSSIHAMASFTVDALLIGAGPGGYHAAIRLGQLGKKVVCFDRDEVGGVCLNWGCIPTKALLHVGEISRQIAHAGELGLKVPNAEVDREGVAAFADKVVKANVGGVNALFKANNVQFAYGDASFTGKNTVSLEKKEGPTDENTSPAILLATGS